MKQAVLPLETLPSYAPQDFVVSESNQAAYDLMQRAPDWPDRIMAITGSSGAGKTHLVHVLQTRNAVRLVAPDAIGSQTADRFMESGAILVVDDVDTVRDEEALSQLINQVRAESGRMLFTARTSIAHLEVKRADLASRLKAIPEVCIHAPDDALLTALVMKAFADRQLRVAEEVISYIVSRGVRTASAMLTLVQRLDAAALAGKRDITLPLVRETLSDSA